MLASFAHLGQGASSTAGGAPGAAPPKPDLQLTCEDVDSANRAWYMGAGDRTPISTDSVDLLVTVGCDVSLIFSSAKAWEREERMYRNYGWQHYGIRSAQQPDLPEAAAESLAKLAPLVTCVTIARPACYSDESLYFPQLWSSMPSFPRCSSAILPTVNLDVRGGAFSICDALFPAGEESPMRSLTFCSMYAPKYQSWRSEPRFQVSPELLERISTMKHLESLTIDSGERSNSAGCAAAAAARI